VSAPNRRDQFAMAALTGFAAGFAVNGGNTRFQCDEHVIAGAWAAADAMLAANGERPDSVEVAALREELESANARANEQRQRADALAEQVRQQSEALELGNDANAELRKLVGRCQRALLGLDGEALNGRGFEQLMEDVRRAVGP